MRGQRRGSSSLVWSMSVVDERPRLEIVVFPGLFDPEDAQTPQTSG